MLQRMEDALTSSVNSWWSRGATHLFEEPDTLETPWGYTTMRLMDNCGYAWTIVASERNLT